MGKFVGTTIGVKEGTKVKFDKLKATVAKTMSSDEFLDVLLTAYENRLVKEVAAR